MKKLLLILLVLSGCVCVKEIPAPEKPKESFSLRAAVSTPVPGYDVLGLPKYCSTFLKAPKLPGLSTLLKSPFGDPRQCVEDRIAKGGVQKVQFDLIDATCYRRPGACPADAPKMPALSAVRARARLVQEFALKYPNIEWWVSPWLEHDVKYEDLVKAACNEIRKVCPTCKCINSPFTGAKPAGIPIELHGTKVSSFAVSGDGASIFDGDNLKNDGNNFQHRIAGSNQSWAWWEDLNLRCTGEKVFTPIPERTNRPELWQFQVAHKIMTSIEDAVPPPPAQCKTVRKVNKAKGEIVKPFAEFYCNGGHDDGRGNHPLLILTKGGKRGDKMSVYAPSGKSVACYEYYGTYSVPGLHRWYMSTCSGQNSWELYASLGQEWGYANLGSGNCLLFNSIRRMGIYR